MPAIVLERLPLPSLHTYISLSVLILALATFYAHQTVRAKLDFDPNAQLELEDPDRSNLSFDHWNISLPYGRDEHFLNMVHVMTVETWCIWTLVNTCYCLLILLGKFIQNIVFGELRVSEQQHIKDKFWNFVFYKFIFIFGVMNVQSLDQVVLWVAWFSCLGFFHLLSQLCKDRFEYLSFSPATPWISHVKLLCLLLGILVSCGLLLAVCAWVAINISLTIFAFLGAESVLLLLNCLYVVVRYIIHLREMSMDGVWEGRAVYVYYTELFFELMVHSIDFAHHLHMLIHKWTTMVIRLQIWHIKIGERIGGYKRNKGEIFCALLYGNIFLSMASLVICMQLRYLFYEFQRRIKRHKNYLRVVKDMEAKFPMATQEDLEQNADDCAICWEKMEVARKLPCGHLFHNSCLRSWLEQDTSCPTCRTTLNDSPNNGQEDPNVPPADVPGVNPMEGIVPAPNQGTTNHFFHFDGSRYVSWLPSFSLEVTHTNLLPGQQAHATQTSQLDNMAREVQGVFPNIPQSVILDDLRLTRSVDITIDNILEGRVTAPPVSLTHQINESHTAVPQEATPPPVTSDIYQAISSTMAESLSSSTSSDQLYAESRLIDVQPTSSNSMEPSVPLNTNVEESSTNNSSLGGRFSKSASERMSMLEQRKRAMIEQAQRRYQEKLDKQESIPVGEECLTSSGSSLSQSSSSSSSSSPSAEVDEQASENPSKSSSVDPSESDQARRRAILLEATQRRLERGSPSS